MGTGGQGGARAGGGGPTLATMSRQDYLVKRNAIDRALGQIVRNIQNNRAAPDAAAFQRGVEEALDSALARGDNNEFWRLERRSLHGMAVRAMTAADRAQRAGNMARASRFRGRASAYLQAAQRLMRREAHVGSPVTESVRGFTERLVRGRSPLIRGLGRSTRQAVTRRVRRAPMGRQAAQAFARGGGMAAARAAARAGGLTPGERARNARLDAELAAERISDALVRSLIGRGGR